MERPSCCCPVILCIAAQALSTPAQISAMASVFFMNPALLDVGRGSALWTYHPLSPGHSLPSTTEGERNFKATHMRKAFICVMII